MAAYLDRLEKSWSRFDEVAGVRRLEDVGYEQLVAVQWVAEDGDLRASVSVLGVVVTQRHTVNSAASAEPAAAETKMGDQCIVR